MLFFINPNAGHAEIRGSLMEVLRVFAKDGYEITTHPTNRAKEIPEVIAAKGAEYDIIVSAGGDGTFNETVCGLMRLNAPPPLGYIPSGTVNDLASTLGLSLNPIQAAKDIVRGQAYPLDVGSFQNAWFAYVAAFGILTDVPYQTPQQDKRILGRLAYLLSGVKSLTDIRPTRMRLTCNGQTVEDQILVGLVTSANSVGGFQIGSDFDISLNDGQFEVILLRDLENLIAFSDAAGALLRRDFNAKYFHTFQTSEAEFTFEKKTPWTLDGEFGGAVQNVVIKNHKQAISILIP